MKIIPVFPEKLWEIVDNKKERPWFSMPWKYVVCKKEKKKKKETYFHCIIKAKQNIRCKQRLSILEK